MNSLLMNQFIDEVFIIIDENINKMNLINFNDDEFIIDELIHRR